MLGGLSRSPLLRLRYITIAEYPITMPKMMYSQRWFDLAG